jgi:lactate dehydrogenase-like 2-hydroxyacid dehydrogenase
MRVLYHSRHRNEHAERELGCAYAAFEELLSLSDAVTVHVPLMPETRHLFNEAAFRQMKPTAIFVNTSRGAVVDETALHHALASHQIAAAAIDVTETEPMSPHDPLLRLPNLLVTPHIASASVVTRGRMAGLAVDNLLAVLSGGQPAHCVNEQVLAERAG